MFSMTEKEIFALLPKRDPAGHKYSFGAVLSVCGCVNYPGAAVLAAQGAVGIGTGLVTAAFPKPAYAAIAPQLPLCPLLPCAATRKGMFRFLGQRKLTEALSGKSAVVLGCGLGRTAETTRFARKFIRIVLKKDLPFVIDADGINALAAHRNRLPEPLGTRCVLTPHEGEMARLMGMDTAQVRQNRETTAALCAARYGCVVVLKGAGTLVAAPERETFFCTTGNDGLAKGGSGDLLAGMVAGFCAQGQDAYTAAICAVSLHGAAADLCAKELSRRGMSPLACLDALKMLLRMAQEDGF
jgi:NAD(P)H-hydrate epimerase